MHPLEGGPVNATFLGNFGKKSKIYRPNSQNLSILMLSFILIHFKLMKLTSLQIFTFF